MNRGDDARKKAEDFERAHKLPQGTADVLTPYIENTLASELARQEQEKQVGEIEDGTIDDLVVAVDIGDGNVEIHVDLHECRSGLTTMGSEKEKDDFLRRYGKKVALKFCAEHGIDDAVVDTLTKYLVGQLADALK